MSFEGSSEDRLALRDLLDTYADAVSRADGEAWAATWTEDAEWHLPGLGTIKGRRMSPKPGTARCGLSLPSCFGLGPARSGSKAMPRPCDPTPKRYIYAKPFSTGPTAYMRISAAGSLAAGCLPSGVFNR